MVIDIILARILDLSSPVVGFNWLLSSGDLSTTLVNDEYLLVCYDIILCVTRDVMIVFTIAFMMASDSVYFWFYVCQSVSVELRIGSWAAQWL